MLLFHYRIFLRECCASGINLNITTTFWILLAFGDVYSEGGKVVGLTEYSSAEIEKGSVRAGISSVYASPGGRVERLYSIYAKALLGVDTTVYILLFSML